MNAYFDISPMLDEFYKKADFMSLENLVEASKTLQSFLNKYIDTNSDLFKRGIEVTTKMYQAIWEKIIHSYKQNHPA